MEITTVRALRAQDDPGNAGNCTLEDLGLGMKGFTTKILPVNTGQSGLFSLLCSLQPAMFYFRSRPHDLHTHLPCLLTTPPWLSSGVLHSLLTEAISLSRALSS